MPRKKTPVSFTWGPPMQISLGDSFKKADLVGVYVIYSGNRFWEHPTTSPSGSSIVYIGEGIIPDRLTVHCRKEGYDNEVINAELKRKNADIYVRFAEIPKDPAQCVEDYLINEFEERYGEIPPGNLIHGTCPIDADLYEIILPEEDIIATLHHRVVKSRR